MHAERAGWEHADIEEALRGGLAEARAQIEHDGGAIDRGDACAVIADAEHEVVALHGGVGRAGCEAGGRRVEHEGDLREIALLGLELGRQQRGGDDADVDAGGGNHEPIRGWLARIVELVAIGDLDVARPI